MITMKISRVDYRNNNTPILYDREIEEFAESVLADYKPELLREPGKIRFEHFIEYYLGLKLLYKDIYRRPKPPDFRSDCFSQRSSQNT